MMRQITILLISGFLTAQSYTLETCETHFESNVPEFYQKYFHCVSAYMSESGEYINLYFNGTPPYLSWYWNTGHSNDIPYQSQGPGYYQNPGSIGEFDLVISIPVDPQPRNQLQNEDIDENLVDGEVGSSPLEYGMGSVGAALNGVNMFNPLAAPGDIIENEAYSFDMYSGHPAGQNGYYHYHTTTQGPLEVLNYKMPAVVTHTEPGEAEVEIYGIMCDGTVVMGCTETDGTAVEESGLDAQHGHSHDFVDETGTVLLYNRYHTHICYDDVTDSDLNGNGYPQHEFTPEIQYYDVPDAQISFEGTCGAMDEPFEPNMLGIDETDAAPNSVTLSRVYPNPFNPMTTVSYKVNEPGTVQLDIFDLAGKKVETLVKKVHGIGSYTIDWNAELHTAGIYFIRLEMEQQTSVQKVILLK